MTGPIADQRHGRLIEKDTFGHHLLLQERQQSQDDVDFLGGKHDVAWVVVAVDADVAEFEAEAGEHHQLDAIDFDLAAEAGFELLKKKVFEDIDAEELARIQEEEHTHHHQAEQRQHYRAGTNPHSTSRYVAQKRSVLDAPT